ncbi:MAG: hypothetical protein N2F24_10040 [Deltaproteobacteria bacterium]
MKKGYKAGKKNFKVHLDGYNFLPYLTGKAQKSPRRVRRRHVRRGR